MTKPISKPQNPLHIDFNRESKNKSFVKRFPTNTKSIDSRSKSLSRPLSLSSRSRSLSRSKFTAGPGPRVKVKAKPRKRTKKIVKDPKPKPKPRIIKTKPISNLNLNLNLNSLSPLTLANKIPNTPRGKSSMMPTINTTAKSNLSLLDTILKPMPTNTSKSHTKSQAKGHSKKVSNLGIAF